MCSLCDLHEQYKYAFSRCQTGKIASHTINTYDPCYHHEQYEHEKLLLSEEMLELCHPDDGHQWLLELQLRGGAASQGGNLPETDIGASMALLEELEEVVSIL